MSNANNLEIKIKQVKTSICSSQDIKVEDNFNQVGKENFTKLVLSALEVSKLKHNKVLTSTPNYHMLKI